jgi:tagatose 6-phosphate kinase
VILCLCLSPAVDVTYHVDRVALGTTVRVGDVSERPGGKAVNVSRVLHALGEDVSLVAPVGGDTGEQFRHALAAAGLGAQLVPNGSATRRTVTVVDAEGGATCLVEPAAIDCWPELLETVDRSLARARALVVSGSVPAGVPEWGLTDLLRRAHTHGVPVIADTHGLALLEALEAHADVVKPNAEELAHVTDGPDGLDSLDPVSAARGLVQRHGSSVVVSLGPAGVVAVTPGGAWEACPGATVTGNPTGAGDALVAGLARGLARDPAALTHPEDVLRDAVALSAAAVHAPTAGEVDPAVHAAELARVDVRPLGGAA